jgi:hypothetical protein
VFKKIGIPLAPFTLALVLGNRAEDAFRLSMIGAGGDMRVFWSNGLVGSITTLALILLFWPVLGGLFKSVGVRGARSVRDRLDHRHASGPIATVVLDRPDKLNALTKTMWQALGDAFARLAADAVAALHRRSRRGERRSRRATTSRSSRASGRTTRRRAHTAPSCMRRRGTRRLPHAAGRADPWHLRGRRPRDRRAVRLAHLRRSRAASARRSRTSAS